MRSRKSLVKEADRVFSLWLRKSMADHTGYIQCYVCRKSFLLDEIDAGHFISRSYLSTRWHRVNVWPECIIDNRTNPKHLVRYESHLISDFGEDIIDALWEEARNGEIPTDDDIRNIIKSCNTKLLLL